MGRVQRHGCRAVGVGGGQGWEEMVCSRRNEVVAIHSFVVDLITFFKTITNITIMTFVRIFG